MCFFFSSRRRHTRSLCDWSSDVCSSDLTLVGESPSHAKWCEWTARGSSSFRASGTCTRITKRPAGKRDRKSTRLNSSHTVISYAVFCLKKKKNILHSLLSYNIHRVGLCL